MNWLKVGVNAIPDAMAILVHSPDGDECYKLVYHQSAQWNGFKHGLWIRFTGESEPAAVGDLFYPVAIPLRLPRTCGR